MRHENKVNENKVFSYCKVLRYETIKNKSLRVNCPKRGATYMHSGHLKLCENLMTPRSSTASLSHHQRETILILHETTNISCSATSCITNRLSAFGTLPWILFPGLHYGIGMHEWLGARRRCMQFFLSSNCFYPARFSDLYFDGYTYDNT